MLVVVGGSVELVEAAVVEVVAAARVVGAAVAGRVLVHRVVVQLGVAELRIGGDPLRLRVSIRGIRRRQCRTDVSSVGTILATVRTWARGVHDV